MLNPDIVNILCTQVSNVLTGTWLALVAIHLQNLSRVAWRPCLLSSSVLASWSRLRHFVWWLTEQRTELYTVLWAIVTTHTSADVHIWLEFLPLYRIQDCWWQNQIRVCYPNKASFSIASNHYYFGTLTDPPGDLLDFWSLTDVSESQWLPKTVFPSKAYVPLSALQEGLCRIPKRMLKWYNNLSHKYSWKKETIFWQTQKHTTFSIILSTHKKLRAEWGEYNVIHRNSFPYW